MCVYVCMVHVCGVCTCVYAYVCMCLHVCMCVYTCMCVYVCVHECMVYGYVCMFVHIGESKRSVSGVVFNLSPILFR